MFKDLLWQRPAFFGIQVRGAGASWGAGRAGAAGGLERPRRSLRSPPPPAGRTNNASLRHCWRHTSAESTQAGGRASAAASGERANAPPHAASPLYRLAAPRCQQVPAPPPPPPLPARSGPRSRWPPDSRKRPHPPTALSPIHPLRPGTRLETMPAPNLICSLIIFNCNFFQPLAIESSVMNAVFLPLLF